MRENLVELIRKIDGRITVFAGMSFDEQKECLYSQLADHLIANGVTIAKDNNVPSKWIPVTERLPEIGTGKVLVVKNYRGKPYVDIGEIIEGTAYCANDEFAIHLSEHKLTHWMPLPTLPKGE